MTEPIPAAEPRKRRDPEFWLSLAALLVSGLAMAAALLQANAQRNQERASVWPHVRARPAYSASGYSFVASNKGLGPALVRHVELKVDGKPVDGWGKALDAVLGAGHGYGWETLSVNDLEDTILASNESVVLFGVPWDERIRKGLGVGQRISVQVCYCSFLEECWKSREGIDHERVERCPSRQPAPPAQ